MKASAYYDKISDILYFNLYSTLSVEVKFLSDLNLLETMQLDGGEYSFHHPQYTHNLKLVLNDGISTLEIPVSLDKPVVENNPYNRDFPAQTVPNVTGSTVVEQSQILEYDFNTQLGVAPDYIGGNRYVFNSDFIYQEPNKLLSPQYVEVAVTNLFSDFLITNCNKFGVNYKPDSTGNIILKAGHANAKSFQMFLSCDRDLENRVYIRTFEGTTLLNTETKTLRDFYLNKVLLSGTSANANLHFEIEVVAFAGDMFTLKPEYVQMTSSISLSSYTKDNRIADVLSYSVDALSSLGISYTDSFYAEILYNMPTNTPCIMFKMGDVVVTYTGSTIVVTDGINASTHIIDMSQHTSLRINFEEGETFYIDVDDIELASGPLALTGLNTMYFLSNGVGSQANAQINRVRVVK